MSKQTKTQHAQTVGRARAYYNRNNGGILITAKQGRSDYNGVHWSAAIDCNADWIGGRASGGGYNVRAAALAEAINGIITETAGLPGEGIGWHNYNNWKFLAAEVGWSLTVYGDADAVTLWPLSEVADKIAAELKQKEG
jgi:hypothetical protein